MRTYALQKGELNLEQLWEVLSTSFNSKIAGSSSCCWLLLVSTRSTDP
jgi:hypothetical protein